MKVTPTAGQQPICAKKRALPAFELGHLQSESAGFGCELAFAVAGAERLPVGLALVSGGVGDLVRLKRRASR